MAGLVDLAGTFRIPADHPSLPGHFPGRPVVPGVVLLDEVSAILAARHPGRWAAGWARIKFTHPVGPEQDVTVYAGPGDGGRVAVLCRVDGRDVLGGTALLGPA